VPCPKCFNILVLISKGETQIIKLKQIKKLVPCQELEHHTLGMSLNCKIKAIKCCSENANRIKTAVQM